MDGQGWPASCTTRPTLFRHFFRVNGPGESRLDNGYDPCERAGDDLPSKIGAPNDTRPSGLSHLALPPYGCNCLVDQRLNVVACQISISPLHIGSSLLQDLLLDGSLNELRQIVVSHSMI